MKKQLEKEIQKLKNENKINRKRIKNENKINRKRIKFLRLAIKAEKLIK